jgi:hypothetical protein
MLVIISEQVYDEKMQILCQGNAGNVFKKILKIKVLA